MTKEGKTKVMTRRERDSSEERQMTLTVDIQMKINQVLARFVDDHALVLAVIELTRVQQQ